MSMQSVMCERLRNIAYNLSMNGYANYPCELRYAADTIDSLRNTCNDLQRENEKLREQCNRLLDKTLELGTDNAKLRELVRDMWQDIPKTESCGWDSSANTCTGSDKCRGECALWHRMRELGVEVES